MLTFIHEWSLSLCIWWRFQWVLNSGNAITIFNRRVNFRWVAAASQQSHFSVLLLSTCFNKYLPHQITIYPRRELTTSRLRAKWSNKSKSCGNWPHDDSASDIICKAWQRIFGNWDDDQSRFVIPIQEAWKPWFWIDLTRKPVVTSHKSSR